jgi:hypothetical protein
MVPVPNKKVITIHLDCTTTKSRQLSLQLVPVPNKKVITIHCTTTQSCQLSLLPRGQEKRTRFELYDRNEIGVDVEEVPDPVSP